jgi:hypothetical protein
LNRTAPAPLLKYHLVFLGAYLVLALPFSLLAAISSRSLQTFGLLLIYGAGWVALRAFIAEHGRGFRADERRRMLIIGPIQVAVLTYVSVGVAKGFVDKSMLVVSALCYAILAPILLWFVYATRVRPTPKTGNRYP